jgi:hypothetical protein
MPSNGSLGRVYRLNAQRSRESRFQGVTFRGDLFRAGVAYHLRLTVMAARGRQGSRKDPKRFKVYGPHDRSARIALCGQFKSNTCG